MKKLTLLVALLLVGFSANAIAANPSVSKTATATAVIVTPIGMTKTADLSFGNIVASAAGGTLVVSTSGGTTYTGVSAPSAAGTITAASFDVTGAAGMTYAITLPSTFTLSDGASHSMSVGTFTDAAASGTLGTLSGTGTQTINLGATLTVGASQVAGTYTNAADCTVTVNYN
jgi:hypothetical protein